MSHKRKLKFEDCKDCLEATQVENKKNQPEKNKVDVVSLRENHKESIKSNAFTKEFNKSALSPDDNKI